MDIHALRINGSPLEPSLRAEPQPTALIEVPFLPYFTCVKKAEQLLHDSKNLKISLPEERIKQLQHALAKRSIHTIDDAVKDAEIALELNNGDFWIELIPGGSLYTGATAFSKGEGNQVDNTLKMLWGAIMLVPLAKLIALVGKGSKLLPILAKGEALWKNAPHLVKTPIDWLLGGVNYRLGQVYRIVKWPVAAGFLGLTAKGIYEYIGMRDEHPELARLQALKITSDAATTVAMPVYVTRFANNEALKAMVKNSDLDLMKLKNVFTGPFGNAWNSSRFAQRKGDLASPTLSTDGNTLTIDYPHSSPKQGHLQKAKPWDIVRGIALFIPHAVDSLIQYAKGHYHSASLIRLQLWEKMLTGIGRTNRIQMEGIQHIPKNRDMVVLFGVHYHTVDIPGLDAAMGQLNRVLSNTLGKMHHVFVMKQELLSYPVIGPIFKYVDRLGIGIPVPSAKREVAEQSGADYSHALGAFMSQTLATCQRVATHGYHAMISVFGPGHRTKDRTLYFPKLTGAFKTSVLASIARIQEGLSLGNNGIDTVLTRVRSFEIPILPIIHGFHDGIDGGSHHVNTLKIVIQEPVWPSDVVNPEALIALAKKFTAHTRDRLQIPTDLDDDVYRIAEAMRQRVWKQLKRNPEKLPIGNISDDYFKGRHVREY